MGVRISLTGNYAVAYAAKLAHVDIVAAYPITPQTTIVEKIAELIERGEMKATMINVESEHSALAATFGASIAGARVLTATSSHGLLYMHEYLPWIARARAPAVMAIVTRALAPPWNIWSDHFDFMGERDSGWLLAFALDNQEVLDLVIQAFKISEDPRVYLPVLIGLDAFILSHTTMPVDLPDEDAVVKWLGPKRQPYIIDGGEPLALGNLSSPEDTEEFLIDLWRSMEESRKVIVEVDEEYGKLFGRRYGGLTQCYRCEDAKYLAVSMGSWSGDLMEAVNMLRDEGYPAGALRIRFYRPFPYEEIWSVARSVKAILVFDRSISFGARGQIYTDLVTCIYEHTSKPPLIRNIIAGTGGVNVTYQEFHDLYKKFIDAYEAGAEQPPITWYHRR